MSINLKMPDLKELRPKITVFGVGGAGCNAVNNMIEAGLQGVDFVVANTDSQALGNSKAERLIQMGVAVTEGLGAGSQPEIGRAAAEETIDEINDHLAGAHMVFITAGMGGGTGTGAAPVVARAARDSGILTVGVVTKPFQFEGQRRARIADAGIQDLQGHVDTLIVIPNQNLFRIANEKTTFADAFAMADEVLYSGVACITDLMVKDGLINLDFADVRSVMREMGKAMMGTGEASGDKRAMQAAEAAIANPLLDDVCMKGARGLLISITGGKDMTLFEVDEAASRVREEVDSEANIIFGATFDDSLEGIIRVSVVATGIEPEAREESHPTAERMAELSRRLKSVGAPVAEPPRSVNSPELAESLERELAMAQPRAAAAAAASHPQRRAGDPGVRIGPFRPDPSLVAARDPDPTADAAMAESHAEAQRHFLPAAAERPAEAQPRMPRVEDFPAIAQRQLKARSRSAPAPEDDRRPRSLLARLAHGLARREEDEEPVRRPAEPSSHAVHMEMEPRADMAEPAAAPAPQPAAPRAPVPQAAASAYARPAAPQPRRQAEPQAATGTYDPHGRPLPVESRREDDQLDIPAFLRRQSS
jgi:cell division protein FtsZ